MCRKPEDICVQQVNYFDVPAFIIIFLFNHHNLLVHSSFQVNIHFSIIDRYAIFIDKLCTFQCNINARHPLLAIENNDIAARQDNRQQGTFVLNEVLMKYRNLYQGGKRDLTLEVDKKLFSLMFYELILSARNMLYLDHDENGAATVAKMIVMPNGYYYADKSERQNILFNRAEALYIMREIELRASTLPKPAV